MYDEVRDPRFGEPPSSSQLEILNQFFSERVREALLFCINDNPDLDLQNNKWEFEINDIGSPKIFDKQLDKNWIIQETSYELIDAKIYFIFLTRKVKHLDLKPIDLFLITEKKSGTIFDIRKARVDRDTCIAFSELAALEDEEHPWDLVMPVLEELTRGECNCYEVQELSNILEISKYKNHTLN